MRLADSSIVAVAVGNTSASFGVFEGKSLIATGTRPAGEGTGLIEDIAAALRSDAGAEFGVCSVNHAAADSIEGGLRDRFGARAKRIGRDFVPEFAHSLDDATTLGWDRVLSARAAFEACAQACVVVQAGTAITVDFVDGEGTFHGGAIAPGLNMMLRALHQQTSALPEVRYEPPSADAQPQGKDTPSAMRVGVHAAAVGMVYRLVDRYAEAYGAYPKVIATGGDAVRLFGDDAMVDRVVPELQLLGLASALRAHLSGDDDETTDAWREGD